MTTHALGGIVVCTAVWLMLPVNSSAQAPVTSFDELSRILRSGQEVTVTHADGHRTRGKVEAVTTTTLTLGPLPRRLFRRPSRPQPVVESSVTTVTRKDSPLEGMLIGFAAGYIPIAIAGCAQDDGTGGGECLGSVVLAGPAIGFVGGIIGGLIDAKRNKIVYRAAAPRVVGRATLALAPVLGANTKGVLLRVQF